MERVTREEGFSVLDMPPVRFRRFAGDSKGFLSLDRGRYYTEWTGFRDRSESGLIDPTTQIRFAPSGSEFDGSFRVEGNESHHLLLLHLSLCFRIWGEAGFDTPVRAYRWHSTRAFRRRKGVFRRRKGTVAVATCLDCRAKSPKLRSIEDLLALPSACPKCGYSHVELP